MPIHSTSSLAHKADHSKPTSLWHWLKGTWTDRILLILTLAGITMSWLWVQHHLSGSPMVYIYHSKTLLATYPLHPDHPIHFQAQGDIGLSEITIDSHGVRISHSTCATKRCVLSGHRHHIGDILACVPNRILVSIQGTPQNTSLDAISE